MLIGFLVFILCSVAFSADYYSIVQVDNKATPDTVFNQGDTLKISANLAAGDNFVEWTIESGSGNFLYSTIPSTKFVPTSSYVVLKKKVIPNKASFREVSDSTIIYSYYDEAFYIANQKYYGIAGKFTTSEAGIYSFRLGFRSIFRPDISEDSLFRSVTKTAYDKRYFYFTAKANTTYYVLIRNADYINPKDSIFVTFGKARALDISVQGKGTATVDSAGITVSNYSKYINGDSITITATPDKNNDFSQWKIISGSCTIVDSREATTKVVMGNNDCKIQADFVAGTSYSVTTTPVKYSVARHLFSKNEANKNNSVRFTFDPQVSGQYLIYTSTIPLSDTTVKIDSLKYQRAENDTYEKYYRNRKFYGTYIDTVSYTAGSPIYLAVKWNSNKISENPFWISYAPLSGATYSLKISSDAQGSVKPENSYANVNANTKLSVGAIANKGSRFQKWQVVSGSVTLDDPYSPFTFATLSSNSEIRATYQNNAIYPLSFTEQTFNHRDNYFNESSGSEVRFTWTPPDASYYIVTFIPSDTSAGIILNYGTDSTFKDSPQQKTSRDTISLLIKGKANETMYIGYRDSADIIYDKDFNAKIEIPPVLSVTSNNHGSTYPEGEQNVNPHEKNTITAWPYGGYAFSSWRVTSGNCVIENKKNSITTISVFDSLCAIEPSFITDISAQPKIKIDHLDLGNYPGICAQVSVTDQNNRSINGLTSKDFILFEDNFSLPTQVSRINEVSAISTVLVIDQSGSMTFNGRMDKSKDALRKFISEMGAFDRASIVGFFGGDSSYVHQEMTSDTSLLLASIKNIKGGGGTNIFTGTFTGIQQTINEINPTAVIVFSDGENGSETIKLDSVIKAARAQNTSIYTIGLETTLEHPLKDLADSTGGTFTFAKDASELTGIYASIRDNMRSKYMLCYQTPDTLLNGNTHKITINTSLLNKKSSATTTWQESFMPPTITLTEETWDKINNSQSSNVAIPIQVYISTSSPIITANINIRRTSRGNKEFQTYPLKNIRDSVWEYIVPADSAIDPGIDFYITATDSAGFIGKSPKIPSPSREPYTIAIDNDLPRVSLVSAICADSTMGSKTITIRAADNDDISRVSLFYRDVGDVLFKEVNLYHKSVADSTWFISIPSNASISSGIDFYVRAYDTKGAVTRWKAIGYETTDACFIKTEMADIIDSITITNADTAASPITRSTEKIRLTVKTEDFSAEVDTIIANLRCIESGDMESFLPLIETSSGIFETVIPKDELLPLRDNGTISCSGNDVLIATYKDPAFGTFVYDTVSIVNFVAITYQFLDPLQATDLDSTETTTHANFTLRVTTTSENIHKVDTVAVTLFTTSGDTLVVKAIETDTNSAIFDYTGTFYYVADTSEMKKENLDAILDFTNDIVREKIQAQVGTDISELSARDSLIVFTTYVPADSAEIYDKNLDGQADFVRIHFKKPLDEKIQSIDTLFWNVGNKNPHFINSNSIKMSKDKSWVEVALDSAFEYGKTAPNLTKPPYLRVTKAGSELSQKVFLTDKVGAVPVKAVKRPGKLNVDDQLVTDVQIPPDTLVITLSEKITRIGDKSEWKNLFRYSKTCADTATKPVKFKGAPKIDDEGTNWLFVLDDYTVTVGNCIRMDPKAKYTDAFNNALGIGHAEITGKDGTLYLYEIEANPSVTGIGKKAKWIPPKGNDFETVPDTLSTIRFTVVSPFKADIYIYDHMGAYVNKLHQEFGYKGELDESIRKTSNKYEKLGYLYWNQRSNKGRKVGTGVYIWKILFTFENGHKETITLKSGIRRPPNNE